MWQTPSCWDWSPQPPSESQNVINGVKGEVMVIGIKTNFNVKCLAILSVFANKIASNDRVAKQTRLKMKFYCNQMMN